MGSVDDKLRRGYELAASANGDADALGLALLALHGALEEHLGEALGRLPDLAPEDRQALETPGFGWVPRANMALRYGLITREQRQAILEANRQRQEFAHGGPYAGRQRELDDYAALVAELAGRRPTAARPVYAAPRPSRYGDTAPRAARSSEGTTVSASAWDQRAAVRSTRRRDLLPDSLPVRVLIGAAAVLVLLFAGWRLLSPPQEEPQPTPQAAGGGQLLPAITPAATEPPATPTPEVRQGRIVGLGGAVGFMHEPAGFSTPTLPPPLPEGTVVTLLEQPPVQAEGSAWVKIAYGGYEGWVPQTNVAEGGAEPTTPYPAPEP
jgi:hypothetical protein